MGESMKIGGTGFASIAFGYPNALWGEPQSPRQSRKEKVKMFFTGMAFGAMAGAAFGIGLMCCVVAGKREDQQMEQMRIRKQKEEEPKQIQFRDMEGSERFSLLDGESLCMMAEDGTKEIGICRFVDEKQVDVNGQVWEIGEFLWQMERRGIQVYPLETAEKKKR
jgi:thiamine pyrophosphokinase